MNLQMVPMMKMTRTPELEDAWTRIRRISCMSFDAFCALQGCSPTDIFWMERWQRLTRDFVQGFGALDLEIQEKLWAYGGRKP
jgi:hypothetical protein